jgi:PAS domain S-box-containing protein
MVSLRLGRNRLDADQMRYFDASLDPLWTADLDGRFLLVNPAWERALGYTNDAMHRRRLHELVHPHDRESTLAALAALSEGHEQQVSFSNRCKGADGEYLWMEWSAHAVPAEGVIHGVARDVTAQRRAERHAESETRRLQETLAARTRELEEARDETVQLLAAAAGYSDDESPGHPERIGAIAAEIATELGLSAESVALLLKAAPLHDIGKMAIPGEILGKTASLSAAEQTSVHRHTDLGAQLLFGSRAPVLQLAGMIAASHHERWDGTGYPKGLTGESIPLVGRVVAVADALDALIHGRPLTPALPVARALALIERGAGTQFDPRVVAALLSTRRAPPAVSEPVPTPQAAESRLWHRAAPAHTPAVRHRVSR